MIEGLYYIDPKRLVLILRSKLLWADAYGHAHALDHWPEGEQERNDIRTRWRSKGYVIVECVMPEVDDKMWAVREVLWEQLKALGEHWDFCSTGLMCKRGRIDGRLAIGYTDADGNTWPDEGVRRYMSPLYA